jgi:hypothetical protein
VADFDDQEFESAVVDIAGFSDARGVAEVREELDRLRRALSALERLRLAKAPATQYRRSKIEFYDEYKGAMTALDEAIRGYLVVERKLREVLDHHPAMRIDQIDAKLELSRGVSEMEGRAAEWCKQNKDRNSFEMDRRRQAHLTIKAAADKETARLESERRSALSNLDTEVNTYGIAKLSWTDDSIRNYVPEYGNLAAQMAEAQIADALKLLSFAPLEQIRQEVDRRLEALSINGDGPKKRGRPPGVKNPMYSIREKVVHSLLDAARKGGGELTYSRGKRAPNTLWPALQRFSKCMPSGIVPARLDKAEHRWIRTAYESWVDKAFLSCLDVITAQGHHASPNRSSSAYAPTVFESMPEAAGIKKAEMEKAMERLFAASRVKVEAGPRRRSQIVRCT